jgi:SAM-dependent methyltransferase
MLSSLLRYAPVAADLDPAVGVLDVGCGRLGLGAVFGEARFAGQDTDFAGPVTPAMFAVRTTPGRFPWADAAFDTVVCLDTLANVPAAERDGFVAECARVTARRLLFACGTDDGLPAPELQARCTGVGGFTTTAWPQVNGHLAALIEHGDEDPAFAPAAAAEFAHQRDGWRSILQNARFGDSPRRGYELLRDAPREPLVDPGRFDASTAAALECVKCGTRLRLEPAVGLRCVGCGCIPARDATGTWDLTR